MFEDRSFDNLSGRLYEPERCDGQPPTMDGFLPGLARPLRHQLPPLGSFPRTNDVDTLLDRLDAAGLTWKV
jgi:hypothetical protein